MSVWSKICDYFSSEDKTGTQAEEPTRLERAAEKLKGEAKEVSKSVMLMRAEQPIPESEGAKA